MGGARKVQTAAEQAEKMRQNRYGRIEGATKHAHHTRAVISLVTVPLTIGVPLSIMVDFLLGSERTI